MLLHRYNNIDFILNLPASRGLPLIIKAQEKAEEERLYPLYVAQFSRMTKENYISFEDYKKRVHGEGIDHRPAYQILREIEEIEASLREEENNGNF